ncbi:MAG: DUF3443 domain-containing protein [Comamonadaceae bacterium]
MIPVVVDAGPADAGYNVNRLYVDVKICRPASTECQTIDHVLVDTGSIGLRLLSSVVKPALNLSRVTGSAGFPLLSCVQFVDNTFAWGPLVLADIVLGGKTASSVPIQLIADPTVGNAPGACSIGGTAMTATSNLGANGILGLSLLKEDCGADCAAITHNGSYYTCSNAGCVSFVGAKASLAQQLKNPVPLFATDNNGILIDLPAVGSSSATGLTGSLVFGIGTQSNNQPGTVLALTTAATGYFTTVLGGQSMGNSFLDTGSNGFFFDSRSIPACLGSSMGFYCPATLTTVSATLVGANAARASVSFSIGDASTMFGDASKTVFPNLAGPMGDATSFDWGLPFFYGRRVLMGIEGQASSLGSGPYYAF